MITDCYGSNYSYGGIPQNARLQESIQKLIEKTDPSGRAEWYTLEWEGEPYLVLGRAIRETKNLSLDVLGYETILIHFQQMLSKAEPGAASFSESLETYLDGECFYRGKECPEERIVPETDQGWQIVTLDHTRYFVSSATFLNNRLTFVSYVNHSRLTGVLWNAGRSQMILLILLILFCAAFFQLVPNASSNIWRNSRKPCGKRRRTTITLHCRRKYCRRGTRWGFWPCSFKT